MICKKCIMLWNYYSIDFYIVIKILFLDKQIIKMLSKKIYKFDKNYINFLKIR